MIILLPQSIYNGYSPRKTIQMNGKDTIICADDRFLYSHDSNRLYVALSIAISESIQYFFPMATDNEKWNNAMDIYHRALIRINM